MGFLQRGGHVYLGHISEGQFPVCVSEVQRYIVLFCVAVHKAQQCCPVHHIAKQYHDSSPLYSDNTEDLGFELWMSKTIWYIVILIWIRLAHKGFPCHAVWFWMWGKRRHQCANVWQPTFSERNQFKARPGSTLPRWLWKQMDALALRHPEHFSSHDAIFRQLCVSVYPSVCDHVGRHLYNQHFVVKLVQDHVARCMFWRLHRRVRDALLG